MATSSDYGRNWRVAELVGEDPDVEVCLAAYCILFCPWKHLRRPRLKRLELIKGLSCLV